MNVEKLKILIYGKAQLRTRSTWLMMAGHEIVLTSSDDEMSDLLMNKQSKKPFDMVMYDQSSDKDYAALFGIQVAQSLKVYGVSKDTQYAVYLDGDADDKNYISVLKENSIYRIRPTDQYEELFNAVARILQIDNTMVIKKWEKAYKNMLRSKNVMSLIK